MEMTIAAWLSRHSVRTTQCWKTHCRPPLKARDSIIIGHGSEGVSPFVLDISDRSYGMEVGFLKLFVSTQYVDHSNIPQGSPFKGLNSRGLRPYTKRPNEYFGTVMVPLVVRKHQSPRSPAARGLNILAPPHLGLIHQL
ncbi:hypothetical protein BJ912DRAFT_561571 [Pholiota molesta]|nr:hypothetical protein BJ912DRAFT_561571 [Pholiota molesta]